MPFSLRRRSLRGLLLLLAGAACRTETETADPRRDVVLDHSDRAIELVAGLEVAQVFVPNHDRLTRVAVMLANEGGQARCCEVVLRLRARESDVNLYERHVDCAATPSRDWVELDFPPLIATRGQRFVVSVQSPNGQAGQTPSVLVSSVPNIYPDGKLRVGDAVEPGALRFMTFHR